MVEFFTWAGGMLGEFTRFVVDLLIGFFANLGDSARGLFHGLTDTLGIPSSLVSLLVLLLGLWLLWRGFHALRRRAPIATLVWLLLGVTVLSWLIY